MATRGKQYPIRKEKSKRGFRFSRETVQDRGGQGSEIVEEVAACPACARKQEDAVPRHEEIGDLAAADNAEQQESDSAGKASSSSSAPE